MKGRAYSSVLYCGLLLSGVVSICTGCSIGDDDDEEVLAEVYEEKLTRSALVSKMPETYDQEDSARLAASIVAAWIRDVAMLKTAENNLTESQKDVEQQLRDYRKSLLIYAYERALVSQKMDTVITEDEIARYHEANAENFKLKRYIVKVKFVKIAEDAPRQKQVEQWLLSKDENDNDELYEYSRKYAENFFFNSDLWLFPEDLLKEVPVPVKDLENFLEQKNFHKFDKDGFRYFLYVEDFRRKGDPSPLSLERRRIRDLMLNRRKAELIGKLREEIVSQGMAEGNIKIHTP